MIGSATDVLCQKPFAAQESLPRGLYKEAGRLLYKFQSTIYELVPFPKDRFEEVYALSKQVGFDDTMDDWKQHLRLADYAFAFIDTKTNRLISTGIGVVFDDRVVRIIDILTEDSHRQRGLASTLFAYLLHVISQDRRLTTLELEASASGSALYKKFSFETDYHLISYIKQPPQNEPLEQLQADLHLQNDYELEQVCRLDRESTGFSRTRLIHEVPHEQILVDREGHDIKGFLLYFEDANGIRIGPWVQADPERAEPFLKNALSVISQKHPIKKVYIHVPYLSSQEPAHIQFLKKVGFAQDESISTCHMYRGEKFNRDKDKYYAMWSTCWA